MIVKNISGRKIIETSHRTLRETVEECAAGDVNLDGASLRKARLGHGSFDGLRARGASFWGADLSGADMGVADVRGADFRCADLTDCCFAESDLTGANFEGAYFNGTIFDGAILSGVRISCPSFWSCDLDRVADIRGAVFNCRGEKDIVLTAPPVIIASGLGRLYAILEDGVFCGGKYYERGHMSADVSVALEKLQASIAHTLTRESQNEKNPDRKILSAKK